MKDGQIVLRWTWCDVCARPCPSDHSRCLLSQFVVDIYSGAVVLETVYISSCVPDIWFSVASFTVISDGLRAHALTLSVSLLNSFFGSLSTLLRVPYLKGYQEEDTARCCACFKSTFKSVISLHWKWNKNVPKDERKIFLNVTKCNSTNREQRKHILKVSRQ